jgi:hypothetical protein
MWLVAGVLDTAALDSRFGIVHNDVILLHRKDQWGSVFESLIHKKC